MAVAVSFSEDDEPLPPRPIPTLLPHPLEGANSSPASHPQGQIYRPSLKKAQSTRADKHETLILTRERPCPSILEPSSRQPARLTTHTFTTSILVSTPTTGTTQVSNLQTLQEQEIIATSLFVVQHPQRQDSEILNAAGWCRGEGIMGELDAFLKKALW
ncbi:MAG: hypothetical protein Q9226_001777 [Calogaya cf. arnoldii]